MRRALAAAYRWLDERIGISTTIIPIIVHPVPRNLGWPYVLGSATLIAFVIQVVSGIALAMVYVPSPTTATESLVFTTDQALLGRLIRGIHYFGSGAMVTLIVAHLARTFLFASYKYPRELTWITGSLLLLVTLAMAFTGQLLRWDQDAYWSIVVAASQVGKTPIVGGILMQVLLAGWSVGPATLTRFYATHVFLIPASIFLFVGIHIYLVVVLGISERPEVGRPVDRKTYPSRYAAILRRGEPFFPDFMWRDMVGGLAVIVIVIALAATIGPPEIGRPADPTLVQADPRPDWYFVWYFALLALIPTWAENVVIIGFPLLVGIVLLALPVIAPYGERSVQRRPWAAGAVVLALAVFVSLTYLGYRAPWAPILVDYTNIPFPPEVLEGLTPQEMHGANVFQLKACHSCHQIGPYGGLPGPALTDIGSRYTRDQMVYTILSGRGNMPAYGGTITPQDLDDLVAFLQTLKGTEPPHAVPPTPAQGGP